MGSKKAPLADLHGHAAFPDPKQLHPVVPVKVDALFQRLPAAVQQDPGAVGAIVHRFQFFIRIQHHTISSFRKKSK